MEKDSNEESVSYPAEQVSSHESQSQTSKSLYRSSGSTGIKSKIKKKLLKRIAGPAVAIILMSLLKVPNYASNIAQYRLVRSAIEYAKTTSEIDAEKVAVDSIAENNTWKTQIYDKYSTMRTATWGKFDKYRPEVLYKNLNSSGDLKYTTETSKFLGIKRTKITSVVVEGKKIDLPKQNRITSPIDAYRERINFSSSLNTAVDNAVKPANSLVRSSVAAKIRNDLGVKLYWWEKAGGLYKGLNTEKADILGYKDSVSRISTPPAGEGFPTGLDNSALNDAQAACDKDPECIKETIAKSEATTIDKSGLPQKVADTITKETEQGIFKSAVGVISPIYSIALPLCLIYSGSVVNSKNSIDAQSESATKSFYAVESAADQQKSGKTTGEAVGAFNRKLGDGDSAIDQYSRGETPDTTNEKSPQSGITGEFSLVNSFFGNNPSVAKLNDTIQQACSVLTNVWVNIGIGVGLIIGKIILTIFTLGTGTAAEEAAQAGAEVAIRAAITTSLKKALVSGFMKGLLFREGKLAAESTLRAKAGDFVGKFAGNLAGIELYTVIAKMYVATQSGLINDGGRTSSTGFKDQADMGGDLQNNEMNRKMMYGSPMNDTKTAIADADANSYINRLEAQKPISEKYFALSDSRSAIAVFSNQLRYSAKIQTAGFITNIMRSMSSCLTQIITIINPRTYAASDTSVGQHYGITQWGWTDSDQKIIESDPSFGVLENAKILSDHSSDVEKINTLYSHCFTDSMGTLLSQGDIMRDNDGNILETAYHLSSAPAGQGDCSPVSLGPNNPQFSNHMVFRWRLDQKRQAVLDQNTAIQDVGSITL